MLSSSDDLDLNFSFFQRHKKITQKSEGAVSFVGRQTQTLDMIGADKYQYVRYFKYTRTPARYDVSNGSQVIHRRPNHHPKRGARE